MKLIDFSDQFDVDEKENKILNYNLNDNNDKNDIIEFFKKILLMIIEIK